MEKFINEYGKEVWCGITEDTKFNDLMFHEVEMYKDPFAEDYEQDKQWVMHTNLGSITVLDRMTGFGYRDIETGYRCTDGKFWLASGNFDIRTLSPDTIGRAINLIKQYSNNCQGD